jgi:hypothetical protein
MSITEESGLVKMFLTACFAAISALAGVIGWIGRWMIRKTETQAIENDRLLQENAGLRAKIATIESEKAKRDEAANE